MNYKYYVKDIISAIEESYPLSYQENYDNCGLIIGNSNDFCTGVLCALDCTEKIIDEAINLNCNLIVTHHPLIFNGIKNLSKNNYINRTIVKAIKNDISIYTIHTNIDNLINGVNAYFINRIQLVNKSLNILQPKHQILSKLYTYVPASHIENVKTALYDAGAGKIGHYDQCSFSTNGIGTFRPLDTAQPFIGIRGGEKEAVNEIKLEVLFPSYIKHQLVHTLKKAHPYEEVAYEIISLENDHQEVGSGMITELENPIDEISFLENLKKQFNLEVIKHTALLNKPIKNVAVCGGSGIFLLKDAIAQNADVFITSDVKYHEFFDADNKILLVDIGHWESEQFTINLIVDFLNNKFPNFATFIAEEKTNPVNYYI